MSLLFYTMTKRKINKFIRVFLFLIIFSMSAGTLYGAESGSTNFKIVEDAFGAGAQMNSTNFSVSGILSDSPAGSWSSGSLPLVAGTITSCGKITASGTYTLGLNLTGISGPCFVVSANNVIIEGNGYSITAVSGNSSYAVTATSSLNGGNGYSVNVNNITFVNFTGGVNASGNNSTSGTGGTGGTISIGTSTVGNVISNGGNGNLVGNGGNGGNISISNSTAGNVTSSGATNGIVSIVATDLNLSNKTYTAGTLSLSYSGLLTTTNTTLSALTNLIINFNDLGSYIGGEFPLIPGTINSCGSIYFSGIYTFGNDISGNCNILKSGVTLNGAGKTLIGNITANSYGVELSNISVTGAVSTTGAGAVALIVNNASNLSGPISVTGAISGDHTSSLGNTTINSGGSVSANSVSFVGDVINNGTINEGNAVIGKTTNNFVINTGVGTFSFNASSTNSGTVNGNAIFSASSTNFSGVTHGTVTGNATFNAFTVVDGSVAFSDTTAFMGSGYVNGNIYDSLGSPITTWAFNASSTNIGILKGDAVFNNTSRNISTGTVLGNAIFNNTAINLGSITGNANVYSPVSRPLGGNVDGQVIYHEYAGLYFNDTAVGHGVVGKWDDILNWWTDQACTVHSPVVPTSGDDAIVVAGNIATSSITAVIRTATFQGSSNNGISLYLSGTSTNAVTFNASSSNSGAIIGNATFSGPDTNNTGTVSGYITREYSTGIFTVVTDFTHNGVHWIVQAINGARVDLSGATYSLITNTFQALNNGVFTAWNILFGGSAVPNLAITSPTSGTNIKWSPNISWGADSLCQYKIDGGNFISVDCSKAGSDVPRPTASSHTIFFRSTDVHGNVTEKSVLFTYDNTQPVYTSCGSDILDEVTRPYYYLTSNVGDCTITASTTLRGDNNGGGLFYAVGSITGSGTSTNISLTNVTATGTVSNFNNITVASSTLSGSVDVVGILNSDTKSIFGNTTVESGGSIHGGIFSGNVLNKAGGIIVNSTTTPVTVLGNTTNAGIINGDFVFNATSTNTGVVNGNLTIRNSSTNTGTINGDLKFDTLTSISGAVSFLNSTAFAGTGHVTGSIKDGFENIVTRWIFNNQSSNTGFTIGNSFFYDTATNASTISGDAYFSGSSVNAGTVTGRAHSYNAVSVALSGTVGGGITYYSYPNGRSFNNAVGDNNWSNSSNWFTDTTFAIPLGRTPISGENVVLFASTTLPSDVTNEIFFAVNDFTLSGSGHKVTGNISGNGAYGGYDAYDFNLSNIIVTGTTTAIGGDGIPGVSDGGKGGVINIDTASTGGVSVNGGDPLQNGGDAGTSTITNSFAIVDGTRILAVGGASSGCGYGGSGGNISLVDSSGYILVTATGEDATSTCPIDFVPNPPSRSAGRTSVVGIYHAPSAGTTNNSKPVTSGGRSSSSYNPLNQAITLLLQKLKPITLKDLPKFGSDIKGSFSFKTSISNFLFIPFKVPDLFKTLLAENKINNIQKFVALNKKPLLIPSSLLNSIFTVKNQNGLLLKSYISTNSKYELIQLVNAPANTQIKISFKGATVGKWDKKNIKFVDGSVTILTPKEKGVYYLTDSNAPLSLAIQVKNSFVVNNSETKIKQNVFSSVLIFLKSLFNY